MNGGERPEDVDTERRGVECEEENWKKGPINVIINL